MSTASKKLQNIEKKPPKGAVRFSIQLSEEQKRAKERVLNCQVNFLVGPAGSGKTILGCQIALDMFFKREVNKIIVTRPTVSTQDDGFLPGGLGDKMEPWLVPIRSNMRKLYNKPDYLAKLEADDVIELISIAHFRGRSFDNAIIIVDEFQNLTKPQLAMCISRLGKGSTMIFCGDNEQIDLPIRDRSAYFDLPKLIESEYVSKNVLEDNHRHPALKDILKRLSNTY